MINNALATDNESNNCIKQWQCTTQQSRAPNFKVCPSNNDKEREKIVPINLKLIECCCEEQVNDLHSLKIYLMCKITSVPNPTDGTHSLLQKQVVI